MIDNTVLEEAYKAGRLAYATGRMRAPALDPTALRLTAGMPVGGGAADIYQEFTRGFDAAADEAAARVLAALGGDR